MIKEQEGIPHRDAMKRAGELWRSLDEKEKEKFNKLAQTDQERFQSQLEELWEKNFFTQSDGSKSIDEDMPSKKRRSTNQGSSGMKKKRASDNDSSRRNMVSAR